MEEDPVIIFLRSELNFIQPYKLSTLPHPRVQLLPWTCWTLGCNQHVGMVHQLYFFVPTPWQRWQAVQLQNRSNRWLLWAKHFTTRRGRVVLPTIHSLIIGTTSFTFHTCVWKHPAARWTVCSNCLRQNIPLSMGNVRMSRNCDCKCVIGGLIFNSLSKVSSPSATILLSLLKCK